MTNPHIILSPTLAANEKVQTLRARGQRVYHMGFGQAPFPVHPRLRDALAQNADQQQYLNVAGLPELRDAVLQHQSSLTGINADDYDVIVAPGSKLVLYALQMAIPGDIMLPVPSWVSYAPQASLLGHHVIPVATEPYVNTLRLTRDALTHAFQSAKADGKNPAKLLINFPGNPTGITIENADLDDISAFCREHGVTLISDEIYGRLAFNGQYRTASSHYPEGAVVTTGLSKHLSLGGWRLGVGIVPKSLDGLHERLIRIASETWSCVSSPVQFAAIEAYARHTDIEQYIGHCRDIHRIVNRYIAKRLSTAGINCPEPTGAFYTWPDFSGIPTGAAMQTSSALADHLLEKYGIVTLPGDAFGETPETLRLRLSGCDYDGQHALNLYQQVGVDRLTDHIDSLAPNVVAAMNQFDAFSGMQPVASVTQD